MITVDFARLGLNPGDRVLDIGCGAGRHTCAAYTQDRVCAIGSDVSIEDLREARRKLNWHAHVGAHGDGTWGLNVADIMALPYGDATFDAVICCEVLEHVRHEAAAVEQIVRVLKPGKHLVISVPRFFPEQICWWLSREYRRAPGGHRRIYTKQRLLRLMHHTGVSHQATHYAHSLHTPYWWLKCLVGPNRENHRLVNLYHRGLSWDIMHQPAITRGLDRMLNPVLGKSLVLYFQKPK
jgi:ubiquinone/menaquinone biosynthesis C-methylase UbiE